MYEEWEFEKWHNFSQRNSRRYGHLYIDHSRKKSIVRMEFPAWIDADDERYFNWKDIKIGEF